MMTFAFWFSFWCMLFLVQFSFADDSLHSDLYTTVVAGKNLPK